MFSSARRSYSSSTARRAVKHVVMFSYKEGTTGAQMAEVKTGMLGLVTKIPVIRAYEWGDDLMLEAGQNHPAGKNRMVHWTASFDSVADYQTYDEHPAHKELLGMLKNHILPGSRSAIQYEVDN